MESWELDSVILFMGNGHYRGRLKNQRNAVVACQPGHDQFLPTFSSLLSTTQFTNCMISTPDFPEVRRRETNAKSQFRSSYRFKYDSAR